MSGVNRKVSPTLKGAECFIPVSTGGSWVIAHDDCKTAESAAELLNPLSIANTRFHWVRRGHATRVFIRARVDAALSAVATHPIVRIYGAFDNGSNSQQDEGLILADGTAPTDGTVRVLRLDSLNTDDTGITLTLPVGTANTTRFKDSNYSYSSIHSITGTDLIGADYFGVVVVTAASVTNGTTVPIECMVVN